MSDDGPSDAALDEGLNNDLRSIPGFRGHGPKLSQQSRAINPRAQLMAEHEAQSAEARPPLFGPAAYPPPPADPYAAYAAPPAPQLQPRPRDLHSTLPRGMPRVVPPPLRPPPPPPEPSGITDAEAWDSYALAVLPTLMAQFPEHGASALIPHAAMIADELLEERRRRFQ